MMQRVYTIPLRRDFQKAANWRKTERAVTAVKDFLKKHMKGKQVKLGKELNEKLWENGLKNPPCKVKVEAVLEEDKTVRANLVGAPLNVKGTPATTSKKKVEEKPAKEQAKEEKTKEAKAPPPKKGLGDLVEEGTLDEKKEVPQTETKQDLKKEHALEVKEEPKAVHKKEDEQKESAAKPEEKKDVAVEQEEKKPAEGVDSNSI